MAARTGWRSWQLVARDLTHCPSVRPNVLTFGHDCIGMGMMGNDSETAAGPRLGAQVGTAPEPARPLLRLAAFDLDDTLVTTASGRNAYMRSSGRDWKLAAATVEERLRQLRGEGFVFAIFSNQSHVKGAHGGKAATKVKEVVESFLEHVDLVEQAAFFGATQKDCFRKGWDQEPSQAQAQPEAQVPVPAADGLWRLFRQQLRLQGRDVDVANSFFVGDAAGRPGDHSAADAEFARSAGLRFFTQTDFFAPSFKLQLGPSSSS